MKKGNRLRMVKGMISILLSGMMVINGTGLVSDAAMLPDNAEISELPAADETAGMLTEENRQAAEAEGSAVMEESVNRPAGNTAEKDTSRPAEEESVGQAAGNTEEESAGQAAGNTEEKDMSRPAGDSNETGSAADAPENASAPEDTLREAPFSVSADTLRDAPFSVSADTLRDAPVSVSAPEITDALTKEQEKTVDILKSELSELKSETADRDYVEGEAFFLASSRKEAQKVADGYGAELKSFEGGVATILFPEDEGMEETLCNIVESAEQAVSPEEVPDSTGDSAQSTEDFREIEVSEIPDVPIYPNYIYHIESVMPENDPLYTTVSTDIAGQWFHSEIDSAKAWATGADGNGVKVAVIDTGIDTSNTDLKSGNHIKVLYTSSFRSGEDDHGHGTHCSGIVGALDNELGGLGVAPEVQLISIKAADAEGSFSGSDIAEGIQKAIDNKVDIISMSFGGSRASDPINAKIQAARDRGILCVAAAGNERTSSKRYPAAYPGVLSVGAYDRFGNLASYSNYGSWVTLAAPGSDIYATMPDTESVTLRREGSFKGIITDTCSYGRLNGTSMATPVVAGVAALVKSAHPDYTGEQIKSALILSAPSKTFEYGSHTVTGGINAANAVGTVDQLLSFGVGNSVQLKAGKSLKLAAEYRMNRKAKIIYSISANSDGFKLNKNTGVISVTKNAEPGDSAVVTASFGIFSDSVSVSVIPGDTSSERFVLKKNSEKNLSVPEGLGEEYPHYTDISVEGGDPDRIYRFSIPNDKTAYFANGFLNTPVKGTDPVRLYARGNGSVTVTAYATDGSGYTAKMTVKCYTPITAVNQSYQGVSLDGPIEMVQGGKLQLKALPVGTGATKVSGKVKYIWTDSVSGNFVKNGLIKAPNETTSFTVTVTAENNGRTVTDTVSVNVVEKKKTVMVGYCGYNSGKKAWKYYSSHSRTIYVGEENGGYSFGDFSLLPEGSRLGLNGPYVFTEKKAAGYNYSAKLSENKGYYVVSCTNKNMQNAVYDEYGLKSFIPTKKGTYRIVYTMLDGSARKFTLVLNAK